MAKQTLICAGNANTFTLVLELRISDDKEFYFNGKVLAVNFMLLVPWSLKTRVKSSNFFITSKTPLRVRWFSGDLINYRPAWLEVTWSDLPGWKTTLNLVRWVWSYIHASWMRLWTSARNFGQELRIANCTCVYITLGWTGHQIHNNKSDIKIVTDLAHLFSGCQNFVIILLWIEMVNSHFLTFF